MYTIPIAQLGGFLDRKCNGEPSIKTILLGMQGGYVAETTIGKAVMQPLKHTEKCVHHAIAPAAKKTTQSASKCVKTHAPSSPRSASPHAPSAMAQI
ncbi:hypothetical protein GCN78_25565 [Janthinobacterium rivuli]|nr:hypothetical protein GCN78_25565 [Janthinobacterium sp. FT68W]